ncbi:uncharacterized protein IL334_003849 [Kwoniella shivajii]|uniref:Uncharacterized protein n=1 Tax=Kwoniella shivajii TaxID=564305 RepID=A0ABZ1CZ42_9TREE|nr:hypothetical protein IL334_003849 [Kwoniella shivajii]
MPTVVTSQPGVPVRAARPEAILIVLFLIIGLYVFLQGKRGSSKGGSGNDDRSDTRARRARGGEGDSDLESGKSDPRRRREKRKRNPGDGNNSESSSGDDNDQKRVKQKEEDRNAREAEAEAKAKVKAKAEAEAQQKPEQQQNPNDNDKVPDMPPLTSKPLSDVKWERDANKRPERPSGRSPPVLLKRDEDNRWIRPPLSGKKGVSFDDGGKQGNELKTFASFNPTDAPNVIYDQTHTDILRNHISKERGRDDDSLEGKIDGSQSPLNDLSKIPDSKISSKLISLMQKAEFLCLYDHLDLLGKINPKTKKKVLRDMLKDQWIPNQGPIPEIIFDVIQQMLIEKVVDLPLIMSAQCCPDQPDENYPPNKEKNGFPGISREETMNNFASDHLLKMGFSRDEIFNDLKFEQWKKLKLPEIKTLVYDWTTNKVRNDSAEQLNAVRLLLSYFMPRYRATESYRHEHFNARKKVRGLEKSIGPINNGLINWLRYIGKSFVIARMFSPAGADLHDLSLRISFSPRREIVGLIADYTYFMPRVERSPNEIAHGLARYQRVFERAKYLALRWVDHLNSNVYPQSNGTKGLFSDLYPFHINRLTFRPGISWQNLDPKLINDSLLNSGSSSSEDDDDGRSKVFMNVSNSMIENLHEQCKEAGSAGDSFQRLYRIPPFQIIRINNKRQFHWLKQPVSYTQQNQIMNDKFDDMTFHAILTLIGPALKSIKLSEDFEFGGKAIKDPESVMTFQYLQKYCQVQAIDFGGIIPIEQGSETPPKFLNIDYFRGLKGILLPLTLSNPHQSSVSSQNRNQNQKQVQPSSADIVIKQQWGLNKNLYTPEAITITFHGSSMKQRERFFIELSQNIIDEIKIWIKETDSMDDNNRVKSYIMDKLEMSVKMVKRQIKFVLISPESQSAERTGRQGALDDFEIPDQLIPPGLRG